MKKIIHLSDLHYQLNWEEDQGIVLSAFFKDLAKQIKGIDSDDVLFVFSGDIVKSGGDQLLYESFFDLFDKELNELNITKEKRFCIPGNHDISAEYVKNNFVIHEGIVAQNLNEKEYNDFINKKDSFLEGKFENYILFENKFSLNGISSNILSGVGYLVENNIGIYCLNTAALSSGGCNKINDKGRLGIDTRSLYKWINDCKANIKILVMHHSFDYLSDWANKELEKIINNKFSLCLYGHCHNQSIYHILNQDNSVVKCSAPPFLTNKTGDLGYAIITISENGVKEIQYRQWTKNSSFVSGVNFSNNDDGRVIIKKSFKDENRDAIGNYLTEELNKSLLSFSSQPIIWVEPLLYTTNEVSRLNKDISEDKIEIDKFVLNPESVIIKAPPQFGLTCLAHYFAKLAWEKDTSFWLYLDAKNFTSNNFDKIIIKALKESGVELKKISCVILDSWIDNGKESLRLLKYCSDYFKRIPLIVMQTIEDSKFLLSSKEDDIERKFKNYYLHALTRNHIRTVVSSYNNHKRIGDEDTVISKVVSDLEVLNIPRTPFNCLTLLKVFEGGFDQTPINRTSMLHNILYLLFNVDNVPTYKTKPDLIDCEYVLGRYCEKMIRENIYYFSRKEFIDEIRRYCTDQLIDLEVELVFDVLSQNNILIQFENCFMFRFSFWIYYFCAIRMHQDIEFSDYMLSDQIYISYPEIIEFYTGIDRSRNNALKLLINDLKSISDYVSNKIGMPDGMDPYLHLKFSSSPESVLKMKDDINKYVQESNLPDIIKDRHADRFYDKSRPYNQTVSSLIEDYSVNKLIQSIRASSRALRNSDYANPEIKKELLNEIVRGWEQLSKVSIALTPILAITGNVMFEDVLFIADDAFGQDVNERLLAILQNIPFNIINIFKRDIFSHKMGSLLFDYIKKEDNALKKHETILLLIYERPNQWKDQIETYMTSLSEDSFYLVDTLEVLMGEYRYSYSNNNTLKEIEYLIKFGIAKHEYKTRKPGLDKIIKIPNRLLPKRE